jgi:plastocyanin
MNGTSKKLTIDGSAGSKLEINDSLGLWQGVLAVTKANVELHTLTNSKVSGGNKNSFVEPGFYMHHTGNTTKTFRWPVGVGGNYRPVDLEGFNKPSLPDRWYYVEFVPSAPPFSATLPAVTRNISVLSHWFTTTNATSTETNAFELTFYFDSTSTNDGVYDHTKLQLLQNPGGGTPPAWALVKQGATSSRKGTITSDATITPSLGYFVLGNRKGTTGSIGGVNTLGFTDPMASFDVNNLKACVGDTIKFTNKSQNASNVVYQWTFGDEAYTGTSAGKTFPS